MLHEFSLSNVLFPPTLFSDIGESEMKRVNLHDFYVFGERLSNLRHIKPGVPNDFTFGALHNANQFLEMVCRDAEFNVIPLEDSKNAAQTLLKKTKAAFNKLMAPHMVTEKDPRVIDIHELIEIAHALDKFETIFAEESRKIAIFYVSQKSIYSTSILISNAEKVFAENELNRIAQQAIDDIKRAGRCIAFELPTAAGFHAFRALEAVIIDYLDKLQVAHPNRNLGAYIQLLNDNGADSKVISSLRQIKDLHRNPLFHPTDNLEIGEDIGAFNLATNAISSLVKDMEKRQLFPAN